MSLMMDSPVHLSSRRDFAAFLETQLDLSSDSDTSQDDNCLFDPDRIKRRKIEEEVVSSPVPTSRGTNLETCLKEERCTHPYAYEGMCAKCGQNVLEYSGVPFRYIHKGLSLGSDEIARLSNKDYMKLICSKKLYLVLDLDHTLLNSTYVEDITPEEEYLKCQTDSRQDAVKGSLFRLGSMRMLTKLRPFVHTFLKEASKLFDMYIYTMGDRAYALEMAKLLDPKNVYFNSKVISRDDSTKENQKALDVMLVKESGAVILDDTEHVWGDHRENLRSEKGKDHKENLILMERYLFFASSCRQFKYHCKSLCELKTDESEAEGALATVLQVLKRIHEMFYDPELGTNLADRDVIQVVGRIRKDVLKGCKVVFSQVSKTKEMWAMAEKLGATCSAKLDPSVTHVISTCTGTASSRWAVEEEKYLVNPDWIKAANYRWQKPLEHSFPVPQTKRTVD